MPGCHTGSLFNPTRESCWIDICLETVFATTWTLEMHVMEGIEPIIIVSCDAPLG